MKQLLLLFFLSSLLVFKTEAAPSESAQPALHSQALDDAKLRSFQSTLSLKGYSADVLFNLGNELDQQKKPGLAILCYRRALVLDPNAPDILNNLRQVETSLGLSQQTPAAWRIRTGFFNLQQWTILATLSWGVLAFGSLTAGLIRWYSPAEVSSKFLTRSLALAMVTACILLGFSLWSLWYHLGVTREAVVIHPGTNVYLSPFEKAETVHTLQEGEVVIPDQEYGDYYHIDRGPGFSGWVSKAHISPVIPSSSNHDRGTLEAAPTSAN